MPDFKRIAEDCASQVEGENEFFGQEIVSRRVEWNKDHQKLKHIRRDCGGALRVYSGGRMGFAGAGEDWLSAGYLADRAQKSRRFMGEEPARGFCSLVAAGKKNRYKDPAIANNFSARRDKIHKRISDFLDRNNDIQSLQVTYTEKSSSSEIYRAGEFKSGEERTKFSFSAWAVVGAGESVQTGFSQRSFPGHEIDFGAVLNEATSRARRLLGAEPPEKNFDRLILTKEAASTLVGFIGQMLNGESIVRGRSPLQPDRLGEKIGADNVTLVDNPRRKNGAVSRFYDDEGGKIEKLELFKEGIYRNFFTNHFAAKKSGQENNHRSFRTYRTRPSVGRTNFSMVPGNNDFNKLCRKLGDGPVVTSLQPGSGFNTVSGNFSVGAKGYLVDGGNFESPFCSATLSGELKRLLNNIISRGDKLPLGRATAAPALLVENITLGGS